MTTPGQRPVRLGQISAQLNKRADGSFDLKANEPLPPFPRTLMDKIEEWSEKAPDRDFLVDRGPEGAWRHLTFAEAWAQARAIGQALLERQVSAERPVIVLSGNSIEHGLIALGCQMAGVPYSPISPAYALRSTDYAKLRHIFDLLTPSLVVAADATPFAKALDAVMPADMELIAARGDAGRPATPFDDLLKTVPGPEIDAAFAALNGDTIAKFLFTSGSTGLPKAVINTHGMMACNQVMIANALAFLQDEPPVLVDWLPWNHTAGSNHNFGLVLFNGGTMYIDEGAPAPGRFEQTVQNLKEVAPTVYFSVPKGYEMLVDALQRDDQLRQTFFSRLKVIQYAGAGLSQHVWNELERLAVETLGEKVLIMTGYGSTETAPFAFTTTGPVPGAGFVGVPSPGLEARLIPDGDKMELRVKGRSITPGYWRMPDVTANSFDEEGFYKIGDALRFADPTRPEEGFMFDGRISEDFKLSTGTWVNMGQVRTRLIGAMAPYVRDVVLTGLDRSHIGAMVFLDVHAASRLHPDATNDEHALANHPDLRAELQKRLNALASESTGSSNLVARLIVLDHAPSLDLGEITDKGSINQRAVMRARAEQVEMLYAEPIPETVLEARRT